MQVHDVDLRLLRIFVAIVECGGLSAAVANVIYKIMCMLKAIVVADA